MQQSLAQSESLREKDNWNLTWDDVTCKLLKPDPVRQVRREAVEYCFEMRMDSKVPIE